MIFDTLKVTQRVKYRVSILCCPRARQLSWDISVDAGFECDKAAVLGDTIKGTCCRLPPFVKGMKFKLPRLKCQIMVLKERQLNPICNSFPVPLRSILIFACIPHAEVRLALPSDFQVYSRISYLSFKE